MSSEPRRPRAAVVQSGLGWITCETCKQQTPVNPRSTRRHLCMKCEQAAAAEHLVASAPLWPNPMRPPDPANYRKVRDRFSVVVDRDGGVRVFAPWPLSSEDALELASAIVARIVDYARSHL